MEGFHYFIKNKKLLLLLKQLSAPLPFLRFLGITFCLSACFKQGITTTTTEQATNRVSTQGNSSVTPATTCFTFGAFTSATQCRSSGATCENFMPTGTYLSCWRVIGRTPSSSTCPTINPFYFNDLNTCVKSTAPDAVCEIATNSPVCYKVVPVTPPKKDCYNLQVSSGIYGQSGYYDSQRDCETQFGYGNCEIQQTVTLRDPSVPGLNQTASNCWKRVPSISVLSLTKLGTTPALQKIQESPERMLGQLPTMNPSEACKSKSFGVSDSWINGLNNIVAKSTGNSGKNYFDTSKIRMVCPPNTTPVSLKNIPGNPSGYINEMRGFNDPGFIVTNYSWNDPLKYSLLHLTFPIQTDPQDILISDDEQNRAWQMCYAGSAPPGKTAHTYIVNHKLYLGFKKEPGSCSTVQTLNPQSLTLLSTATNTLNGYYYSGANKQGPEDFCALGTVPNGDLLNNDWRKSLQDYKLSYYTFWDDPHDDYALITQPSGAQGQSDFYVPAYFSGKVVEASCPNPGPYHTIALDQIATSGRAAARCKIKPNSVSSTSYSYAQIQTNGSLSPTGAIALIYTPTGSSCNSTDQLFTTGGQNYCIFSYLPPASTLTQAPQGVMNQSISNVPSLYSFSDVRSEPDGWSVPAQFKDPTTIENNCVFYNSKQFP